MLSPLDGGRGIQVCGGGTEQVPCMAGSLLEYPPSCETVLLSSNNSRGMSSLTQQLVGTDNYLHDEKERHGEKESIG